MGATRGFPQQSLGTYRPGKLCTADRLEGSGRKGVRSEGGPYIWGRDADPFVRAAVLLMMTSGRHSVCDRVMPEALQQVRGFASRSRRRTSVELNRRHCPMEFAPVAPAALSGRAGGHRDGLRGACGVTGPGAAWLGLFFKAFEVVCGARARRGDGACGGARRTGGHACWAGRRAGAHYGGLASAGTRKSRRVRRRWPVPHCGQQGAGGMPTGTSGSSSRGEGTGGASCCCHRVRVAAACGRHQP